jgi:SAM-dependent methyltransferase
MLERCARRGRHGALVHGNFWFSLPFPDASFGVAIALHGTLAHPPDANAPRRLAAELARVVGPGGRVVLELPTRHWFERVAGRDEGGPGVLSLVGEEALFRDRRSGASIAGLVVDPHGWARALEPAFACAMHAISTDEVRIVGARIPS